MKTLDELVECLSRLILAGAIEVDLEFEGGLTVLRWRFPGKAADCMAFEWEKEKCQLSGWSC